MFGTIRKHQKWLLVVIIVGVIIAFVFFFDPTFQSRGQRQSSSGTFEINGKPVTQKMFNEAVAEVRLLYFLNFRRFTEEDTERAQQMGFDIENEAYRRMFRVAKAEEAGVRVSDKTVAELAERLMGQGADMDRFAKELLTPNRLTLDDFERFVRHDVAIQQLSSVVGAAGRLITPAEAETLYRRDHQEMAGDIVFLNLSNYLNMVVITNGALTNWYSQRAAMYHTPERVRVSYLEFPRTNFHAEIDRLIGLDTNFNQRLRESYFNKGASSFRDTNGNQMPETNAIALLREREREGGAQLLAARKANEFANRLYDKQPITLETFLAAAASNDLPVQVTLPFDEEGPTNLNVSPKFAQAAFLLDATNNPVAVQPIEGENGFYIIALKDRFPRTPEPFETITNKVRDDYKQFQAFTLAYSAATNFIAHVNGTNGLAAGKTFEEVALKEGLKVEALPPISRATETVTNLAERINDVETLRQVIFSLEPGKVSTYRPNPPSGGYVVYVRAKLPMDEAKLREELPKFLAQLRYRKQNEIFNQWFFKQEQAANLPTKKQKPPGPS